MGILKEKKKTSGQNINKNISERTAYLCVVLKNNPAD